jgi:hypothetical protein
MDRILAVWLAAPEYGPNRCEPDRARTNKKNNGGFML